MRCRALNPTWEWLSSSAYDPAAGALRVAWDCVVVIGTPQVFVSAIVVIAMIY
jgi:hypothetical protein